MSAHKDDKTVVKFMALFAKLREWIDDDPSDLEAEARTDQPLEDLCFHLALTVHMLERAERVGPERFASPVDPNFLKHWRDYEKRYASKLAGVGLQVLGFDLAKLPSAPDLSYQRKWKDADDIAKALADDFESVLEFAKEQVSDPGRGLPAAFPDMVVDAVARWKEFSTGIDLQGVFRRRALVPFVLIPRHVGRHYGEGEKLSLLTLLRQAQDAFVFGASLAALALMRAVAEVTLQKHYGSTGADLSDLIRNAKGIPAGVAKDVLHRLRIRANGILHFEPADAQPMPDIEREVLQFLHTLRGLIEGAPLWRK